MFLEILLPLSEKQVICPFLIYTKLAQHGFLYMPIRIDFSWNSAVVLKASGDARINVLRHIFIAHRLIISSRTKPLFYLECITSVT